MPSIPVRFSALPGYDATTTTTLLPDTTAAITSNNTELGAHYYKLSLVYSFPFIMQHQIVENLSFILKCH
jgi:hypothetical protein